MKCNMELVNGYKKGTKGTKEVEKETTFWKMWSNDLPGSFPKRQLMDDFESRWKMAYPNVLARLKKEQFVSLKKDLMFMFENYGIAFDYKGQGFFLDKRQYDLIQDREDMEAAAMYGMTKAIS